ncbi:(2,3-dihydroxybenzoyl)adenylate synthase [Agaribacterium sp. ZY112]|uniref:(2,3-dihydroxybenzoyl)adenylate synthase n=1 Tax=Agaribacterium sp. ZY112 TaxID=3233574 RepID=UPI003525FB4D
MNKQASDAALFSNWPEAEQRYYREQGFWKDISICHELDRRAKSHPESNAIICGERTFTYRQLHQQIDTLAAAFIDLGCRFGDHAVIHLPNIAEFYIVYLALLKIGVKPVLALSAHRESELEYFFKASRAKLIITANQLGFSALECLNNMQFESPNEVVKVVCNGPDSCSNHKIIFSEELLQSKNTVHINDLLSRNTTKSVKLPTEAELIEQGFSFFQLSGGTTGLPKLIPRTHNDYWYSLTKSAEVCKFDSSTRYLCALPPSHNFPLSSPGALGCFSTGGCVVMAHDPSAQTAFELIEKHQVTVAALVPPLALLWLDLVQEQRWNLNSLKLLQVGGSRLSNNAAKRVLEHFNCQLQQVFGMAEGLVNYTRLDDPTSEIIQSQGRPMCDADQVKIVDERGNKVEQGESGILLTKGPYTICGYYDAPEHNARSFNAEGYYITGDIVRLTEHGNIQVVGRDKDQINRGGEKIAAEEIENHLLSHPDIHNAALIAVDDDYLGEKSCAILVCPSIKPKAHQIKKFLRGKRLANFKIPDRIEFINELPKTPVGKINKKQLAQQFSESKEV